MKGRELFQVSINDILRMRDYSGAKRCDEFNIACQWEGKFAGNISRGINRISSDAVTGLGRKRNARILLLLLQNNIFYLLEPI